MSQKAFSHFAYVYITLVKFRCFEMVDLHLDIAADNFSRRILNWAEGYLSPKPWLNENK